jgi:hypothetical protein
MASYPRRHQWTLWHHTPGDINGLYGIIPQETSMGSMASYPRRHQWTLWYTPGDVNGLYDIISQRTEVFKVPIGHEFNRLCYETDLIINMQYKMEVDYELKVNSRALRFNIADTEQYL